MSWWQNMKRLFFIKRKSLLRTPLTVAQDNNQLRFEETNAADWLKSVESLQVLVYLTRREFEPNAPAHFDWNALSVTTYLNHVERLIIKVREYFLAYKHYEAKGFGKLGIEHSRELRQFKMSCIQAYQTTLNLSKAMKKIIAKEKHGDLSQYLHALELDISSLGSALRLLTQIIYQAEVRADKQNMTSNVTMVLPLLSTKRQEPVYIDVNATHSEQIQIACEELKKSILEIDVEQNRAFLLALLKVYETLLRCYVVARKSVIENALNHFRASIEKLIYEFHTPFINKEAVFKELDNVFYHIEIVSFSSNRESRFSRHLFEKAKLARQSVRKACTDFPLGKEYIEEKIKMKPLR